MQGEVKKIVGEGVERNEAAVLLARCEGHRKRRLCITSYSGWGMMAMPPREDTTSYNNQT